MKQFNLSEWLANPSRKVVTRDGREVTIEKTDIHIHGMSHMILGKYSDIYEIWYSNGRINYTGSDCNLDLFFADEEEELTEFEKAIYIDICTIVTACDGMVYGDKELKPIVKGIAKDLLDLARKELEATGWRDSMRKYKEAYEQGKQDVLEDFPKWKKSSEHKDFQEHLAILEDNKVLLTNYLEEGDYYIVLNDLKTLPKEE